MTDEPAEGGGTPEPAAAHDWYYHGTIKRVYYGSESGTLVSEATGQIGRAHV